MAMMGRTHALGGVATLWLLRLFPGALALGLATGTDSVGLLAVIEAFGALLPDLDASASLLSTLTLRIGEESRWGRRSTGHVWEFTPFALPSQIIHRTFGHRGALHSLVGLNMVAIIALVLLIVGYIDWRVATVLLFGYASHLTLDACTPHGIPLFWPRRSRVHLLPPGLRISTGSSMEDLVFAILAVLVLALLITAIKISA